MLQAFCPGLCVASLSALPVDVRWVFDLVLAFCLVCVVASFSTAPVDVQWVFLLPSGGSCQSPMLVCVEACAFQSASEGG